jgi:hypothetical protein
MSLPPITQPITDPTYSTDTTSTAEIVVLSREDTGAAITLPTIITEQGEGASRRFFEFFTANIENPNTRLAYARAVWQFLTWCEQRGVGLLEISPSLVFLPHHSGAQPSTYQEWLTSH